MEIILTPEMERVVRRGMASGHYASPADVVGEALAIWQEQEPAGSPNLYRLEHEADTVLNGIVAGAGNDADPRDFPALNRALEAATASLDRSEGIPGEEVYEELKRRSADRRVRS